MISRPGDWLPHGTALFTANFKPGPQVPRALAVNSRMETGPWALPRHMEHPQGRGIRGRFQFGGERLARAVIGAAAAGRDRDILSAAGAEGDRRGVRHIIE